MKNLVSILIAIHGLSISLRSQDSTLTAEVTFVANEGFLISCQSKKVLIDALYTSALSQLISPTRDVIQKIESTLPPFDNINLIGVTHIHEDHYNRNTLGKYLKNDPQALLVCLNSIYNSFKGYSDLLLSKIIFYFGQHF